jgi:cell wall-associated NlpC family hydrolase
VPFLAFLILAAGAYLVDAAVQNRKPLSTLTAIVKDPGKAKATLAASKGSGFVTAPYVSPFTATATSPSAPSGTGAAGAGAGAAIAFGRSHIGDPYRWAATGPNAWDCSGLVQAMAAAGGVKLPRTSYQMLTSGRNVKQIDLLPGDLVWPDLGHVQMYTGAGMVIEAPHTGAVVRELPMYGFFTARRIF